MQPPDARFDIGFSAEGERLAEVGREFCQDLRALGVNLRTEARPAGMMKASLDWVIPTAIAIFIAQNYFGPMLQEAAKDHYPKIKKAFAKLARRTTGSDREVRMTVVTAGKDKAVDSDPAVLSVWAVLRGPRKIVFRFDHSIGSEDLDTAVEALFGLLAEHHRSGNNEDALSRAPVAVPSTRWAPVVMRFDPIERRWRPWVLDRNGHGTPHPDDAA